MSKSEIDKRTKEELLHYIETAAAVYTPEWRFDRENPDAGTALACVWADMLAKSIGQLNRALDKNRIAFFNRLDAGILPPVPAGGYAVFSMAGEAVEGAAIPQGMGVFADTDDGEVAFETVDDLYATSAGLREIYQVCDACDGIRHIYSSQDGAVPFTLFDDQGANLQAHSFYFCHDTVLDIRHEATIELQLFVRGDIPISDDAVGLLTDPANAVFEYYSTEGYEQLRPAISGAHTLLFHKAEAMPPFAKTQVGGHESFWIRCRLLNMGPFEKFSFENFFLTAKGVYLYPELVNGNGIECNLAEYMPFGERFSLYNEVYFACSQALSKTGSRIDFSFTMDFARIPLNDGDEGDGIMWNWVMKKSDFKVDKEYDLTIESVIWEYYNGNGWSRLFNDESYEDIFSTELGLRSQYRTMTFTCPRDMMPVLINSCEACYIRARIVRINNLYKTKGYYVAPILSDTVFSYDYARNPQAPQRLCLENNLELTMIDCTSLAARPVSIRPFKAMGIRETAVYMGFDQPLDNGPVKILFTLAENTTGPARQLRWEFSDGRGFAPLNLVDETDGFSRTGIVTIMGNGDFRRQRHFGMELYWVRIVWEGSAAAAAHLAVPRHAVHLEAPQYAAQLAASRHADAPEQPAENKRPPTNASPVSPRRGRPVYPLVTGIYMNAVRISNVDLTGSELFFTQRYEAHRTLQLLHPHIISIHLWVDEAESLGERQLDELRRQTTVECVRDGAGILEHVWVLWAEVPDFIGTDGMSRCYVLDRNAGVITFGDGRHGRIVPAGKRENIRVSYRCGGGERTNLPAGAISRMARTVGFISAVTNPMEISGGCDQETLKEALDRNGEMIRHHFRAVTADDFEQLVLGASRNIRKVRCFTGLDGEGQPDSGAVTMVVLQKEFGSGHYAFNDIRQNLYAYMKDKIPGQLMAEHKFFIVEPEFVEICIRVELIAQGGGIFKLRTDIGSRLEQFLNPLTGHFDGAGWQIGTLPTVIQIQNLLRDVSGVRYIKNIYLTAFVTGNAGRCEVDPEQIRRHPYILPVNGSHDIRVMTP